MVVHSRSCECCEGVRERLEELEKGVESRGGSPMHIDTAQAGTREWLEASKNMVIVAYVGARAAVPDAPIAENEEEPLFGTHIKETIEAFKHLFGKKIGGGGVEYRRVDLTCDRCGTVIGTGLILQTMFPWLWLQCPVCFSTLLNEAAPQSCEDVEGGD